MKKPFILFLLSFSFSCSFSQTEMHAGFATTIYFNRTAFPIYSYTKTYQQHFMYDSVPAYDGSTYRAIDNYKIVAADYTDKNAKFTLALNIIQKPKQGMAGLPNQAAPGSYQVYIAHYKADSIYILTCNPFVIAARPFIVQVGKQEYKCTLSADIKKIDIQPIIEGWATPKFKLNDTKLPADTFKAIGGKKYGFEDFENQGRYIYITTLGVDYMTNKIDINSVALNSVCEKYKDHLTTIIFVTDSAAWQKTERPKENNWIVSTLMYFPGCDFQFNFTPNGELFDSTGKIINPGLLPSELGYFMEKLLPENAK